MSELSPPRIVCAAMRNKKGAIICGARHYDKCMHGMLRAIKPWYAKLPWIGRRLNPWSPRNVEQGFIDQHCNFLTREEALKIALKNGQRLKRCGGDEYRLDSSNLY